MSAIHNALDLWPPWGSGRARICRHWTRVQVKTIPQQSNSHDCGPFVLTYLEHFAANPPANIVAAAPDSSELLCYFPACLRRAPIPHPPTSAPACGGSRCAHRLRTWLRSSSLCVLLHPACTHELPPAADEGAGVLVCQIPHSSSLCGCRGTPQQTRFLRKNWFPEHNPAALRVRIMRQLLQLLVEQAPRSSLKEPRRGAALGAACDLMQRLDLIDQHGRRYEPPGLVATPVELEAPPAPATASPTASGAEADAAASSDRKDEPVIIDDAPVALAAPRPLVVGAAPAAAVRPEPRSPAAEPEARAATVGGVLADASEEDVVEMPEMRAEGGADDGTASDGVLPVMADRLDDDALELEAVVMALHGGPVAGGGASAAAPAFAAEADELGVLDMWHPDDLWE